MSRGERILQGSLALHHETLQVAWEASLSRIRGVEYQEAHERYIIIRFELDSEETCWALRPARELLGPHPVANRQWDQRRASMQGPQGKRRGQRGSLVATTFGTTCPEHRSTFYDNNANCSHRSSRIRLHLFADDVVRVGINHGARQ